LISRFPHVLLHISRVALDALSLIGYRVSIPLYRIWDWPLTSGKATASKRCRARGQL